MSAYLERAWAEWDRMSLAERIEALDADDDGLTGFLRWAEATPECLSANPVSLCAAYLRNHPRFAAWLDREAQRQQALEEEPDDWED